MTEDVLRITSLSRQCTAQHIVLYLSQFFAFFIYLFLLVKCAFVGCKWRGWSSPAQAKKNTLGPAQPEQSKMYIFVYGGQIFGCRGNLWSQVWTKAAQLSGSYLETLSQGGQPLLCWLQPDIIFLERFFA